MKKSFLIVLLFMLIAAAWGANELLKQLLNTVSKLPLAEESKRSATLKGKTVLLDCYHNNEWRKDSSDNLVRWHYTWEDQSDGGFSILGNMFRKYGIKTQSLTVQPTEQILNQASIFIIVDPDTEKETANPHYLSATEIEIISRWVKSGGVLLLMGNDAGNAEFKNFNQLSSIFGIHFNEDCVNKVQDDNFEQGAVLIPNEHSIFRSAKKIFLKDCSSLQTKSPAVSILENESATIMTTAKYGKGHVFAIGDPWLYNEYADHRKLTPDFDNDKAAEDWVKWLINIAMKKST